MAVDETWHQTFPGRIDFLRRGLRGSFHEADSVSRDSDAEQAIAQLLAVEDARVVDDKVAPGTIFVGHRRSCLRSQFYLAAAGAAGTPIEAWSNT